MSSSYEFEDPVSDKLQAVTNEEDEVALKVAVPQTLPEDGVVGMKSILKKVLKCLKKGGGGEEEEEEDDDDYEEEEEEEEGDDYDEEEEEEDDDDDYDEEEDDDVGIIGVYGMGGVGKTTLLDQIKEKLHREMKNDFDVVIWVVVSRDLQHDKIQQQIGEQIGLFDDKAWKHKNSVKKALVISNILKEKKFVLLMDDLWGRVDLTKVGVPLPSPENSSKIVFTTRSLQICSLMEADKLFKVTCLSDNDAWKLFKALVGDETLRSHREDSIARVCRECHGLPLALVSIGQTVRKKPPEEWDDLYRVLRGWTTSNSGLDDQLKKDIRDNLKLIRNNLKLSYDILQNDMFKSCFLYCCLFPTYLRIKKQDLIDYWIGEGFLDERLGAVQSRGHYIVDVFLSVCLLEQSGFDDSYVKMNYWIRDMSLWIASEIETEKGNCVFFHDIDNFKDDENLKKATRISFPPFEFNEEVMKKLPGPPTCPLLQTLFLIRNRSEVIRNAIRKDHYFNFMPSLKVLNLSLNSWLTELPPGILKLISLQHLDLSGTKIEKLPKELTVLKILKCLNLEETRSLSEIPRQLISEFSMLHVLRLRECGFMLKPNEDTVVSVSKEDGVEFNDAQLLIEELLYLKNLSMLSITLNNSHALQRLLSSNRLQSCIQSLRLQDLRHPKSIKVSLTDLKHLNTLEISNCEYLEELEVDFVGEAQDVRESPCSFYFLHEVIISKCRKLRELTWLILAPNLKHLRISNCAEMEEIINVGKLSECPELMGNVIPFSKLKFLTLKYLPKLRSIYWSVLPFPDLKELARTDCPMLLPLPPNLLNKVYVLPVEPSSVENPANRAKQVIASGGSGKSLEVPSNRDVSAKSAKLKIVIKLQVKSDKCRSKAMKIVAGEDGVMSVSWEGQDKDTMVVTGDGVDAVALTVKLSKKLGFAKLLSEEYVTSQYRKLTGGTGKSKVPSKRTYLPEMAEEAEAEAKGNAAFSAAIRHFTDAIDFDPINHILYSNKFAAHASFHNALADAKKTVEIKPDWPKGYSRLGAAHLGLQNHAEAISAYKKGLEIDPNNEALKSGLADAQAAVRSRSPQSDNPFASAFSGPEMWTKLTADPSTRSFLQQPDFFTMMQEIQKNPNNLNLYLNDHRVAQALGVLLNVKLRGANGGDEMEMEQEFPNSSSSEPARE